MPAVSLPLKKKEGTHRKQTHNRYHCLVIQEKDTSRQRNGPESSFKITNKKVAWMIQMLHVSCFFQFSVTRPFKGIFV